MSAAIERDTSRLPISFDSKEEGRLPETAIRS